MSGDDDLVLAMAVEIAKEQAADVAQMYGLDPATMPPVAVCPVCTTERRCRDACAFDCDGCGTTLLFAHGLTAPQVDDPDGQANLWVEAAERYIDDVTVDAKIDFSEESPASHAASPLIFVIAGICIMGVAAGIAAGVAVSEVPVGDPVEVMAERHHPTMAFSSSPVPLGVGVRDIHREGLDLVDLDLDGDPDLLVAAPSNGQVLRGTNDGNGAFSFDAFAQVHAYGVRAANLDGDGALDVVTAGTELVIHWAGSQPQVLSTADPGKHFHFVEVCDLDGDATNDLVVGGPSGLTIYLRRGEREFEGLPVILLTGQPVTDAACTKGQNGPELVVVAGPTHEVFRIDDPSGALVVPMKVGDFERITVVGMGELFGTTDGTEVVAASTSRGRIGALSSEPNVIPLRLSLMGPAGMVIANLDDDGRPDLAVTQHMTGKVAIYRNSAASGMPGFQDAGVADGPPSAEAIVAGDVNGDGRTDLVVASRSKGELRVLLQE